MEWKHHYTGIDIAEMSYGKINLYFSRNSDTKRLKFARINILRHMVGVFIGRGNYVKGQGGWELFTNSHHIGWSKDWGHNWFRVNWSGSNARPWESVTWRVGRFGIGGSTPKWLKRIKTEREARKFEEWVDNMPDHEDWAMENADAGRKAEMDDNPGE
jgi:hypothetical protein